MKKAIVFGDGISGKGATLLLKELGYNVLLVDDKTAMKSTDAIKEIEGTDLFVKSPGIPYTELVKEAFRKNVEVIDEIELAYRYLKKNNLKAKIVTITGTNGKSTTTAKIAELICDAGYKAIACGNIGKSMAETIYENHNIDYLVLEASSFQLENIKEFTPYISMIINLGPDHIERYNSFDEYYDTKFNICKNCDKKSYFIENIDDENIVKRENLIPCKKISLSKNKIADIYINENNIVFRNEKIINIDELALKGRHNLENCMFMIATAKLIGIDNNVIANFLKNAKPLEHRTENFYNWGKVKFINDSKATNVDSANVAIDSYPGCTLICGGYDKKVDLLPLVNNIIKNVKEVYLIGTIADQLNNLLIENGFDKNHIYLCRDVETTLKNIKNRLTENEERIILFSPATSSYDQFKSFEHRGKVFKKLVLEIFGG